MTFGDSVMPQKNLFEFFSAATIELNCHIFLLARLLVIAAKSFL
jgi:hypothetical protein